MKKKTTIIIIIISIFLVILYTIAGTYSVIINVTTKDGITEIVNDITIKDLLINDDGTYNDTYYQIKRELNVTETEADTLMNSPKLNDALQIVLQSIADYKVNNDPTAKLSDEEIYNLITDATLNTPNITDDLKSRVINKCSLYKKDISTYLYDIEVSIIGDNR